MNVIYLKTDADRITVQIINQSNDYYISIVWYRHLTLCKGYIDRYRLV